MSEFLHVTSIGESNAITSLEDNIKHFLDWSFLNIGGYINVTIPTSGINSVDYSKLQAVTDPSNTIKVWESTKKDWVYESGLSGQNIINVSGIYLNNNFLPAPTGSGNYAYSINYPLGRVTFNKSVSPTSNVSLNYSYRYVQVYKSNEAIWWKEISNSAIVANHRVQLPTIIVELIPRTVSVPRELGNKKNIITQDILLHVFTENPHQRNSLVDTLVLQKDNALQLYDVNKVVKNNVYSTNYKGEVNASGLNYDEITQNSDYKQNLAFITQTYLSELNHLSSSLYNGVVRWSIEIFPY